MRLADLSLAALAAASSPVAAQETPAVDLVAKFSLGAADGAAIFFEYIHTVLKQTGPGTFVGTETDEDIDFTIVEFAPCVFDMSYSLNDSNPFIVRFDANQFAGIAYVTGTTVDLPIPLTDYIVTYDGGERLLVLPDSLDANGEPQISPKANLYLMTSVPVAEMQAAVETLKTAYCPVRPLADTGARR